MSYRVDITDIAASDAEQAYFWMMGTAPDFAGRWYDGLLESLDSLAEMPYRVSSAPPGVADSPNIRMMLYGRRGNTYRILFRVIEQVQTEGHEGIVRVLRIVHAARQLP